MKILIVGLGNLGLFLTRHFVASGFKVFGHDIDFGKNKALSSAGGTWWNGFGADINVVIFALFPKQIGEWAKTGSDCPQNALMVNVSSIQLPGIQALEDVGVNRENILSVHPLFGPVGVAKSGWLGKQIILTLRPKKDSRACALLGTLVDQGVTIDEMSPEEHDKKMLPHALAFLIAELVKVGAQDVDQRFLTGSGSQMLGLLDFTENASPELRDFILSNSEMKRVVPKLKKVLEELSVEHRW